MKKFLVIGNPIEHSLSPKLHNYWIRKNKINAIYEKKLINKEELKDLISKVKSSEISGINVTVPFKKEIIPYLDELTPDSNKSQSVNTVYKENNKVIGHNTDIAGFELGIRHFKYDIKNKKVFILGSGGVAPSIVLALKKMGVSNISISNRTRKKAEELKKIFEDLEIIEWGNIPKFNMIINATSVGLKKDDKIKLDYSNFSSGKFFYDIIYNPKETDFLKKAKLYGNITENGKMMFIYQAHQSFTIWHKTMPNIDDETIKLLD